jgi:hypothetical protein
LLKVYNDTDAPQTLELVGPIRAARVRSILSKGDKYRYALIQEHVFIMGEVVVVQIHIVCQQVMLILGLRGLVLSRRDIHECML